MKILFFGDACWGAEALHLLHQRSIEIVGVVLRTRPTDETLQQAAEKLGLPLFQPQRCNDPEFLKTVATLQPELNLSVSYDQILRQPIIESAPLGFVNFHAGKLPDYRGRSVLNWTLINGEEEIGLTGHFVDEGIDTGDIILQRSLPVYWEDTYQTLLNRVIPEFPKLVVDTVELLVSGSYQRQPQAHLTGSYFPQRGPGDEWIDWNDSSRNIYNKIRAISSPGPGARSYLGDQQLILWQASYDPAWPCYIATPGSVVGVEAGKGIRVKTGDSTLLLERVEYCDKNHGPEVPQLRIGTKLGINLQSRILELEERLRRCSRSNYQEN